MAYIPKSDSVVAFQSNPSVLQTLSKITNAITDPIPVQPPASGSLPVINIGSIITTSQGSVAVAIISGSVAVATGNSSVQVLNFPVTQNISGSVATVPQGTIITSLVSTVPSSVIVGASIFGLAPVNVTNTNINVSGSVAAWLNSSNASVITVGSPVANQSVSGAVQIAGSSPASIVTVGRIDGGLSGSALGIPVEAVIFGETTAGGGGAFVPVKVNPSGTLQVAADVQGSVTAIPSGTQNISGSVAAWLNSSNASVFTVPVGNQSVSGTVGASVIGTVPVTQSGTVIASIVNIVPSSVIVGASIFGLAPVNVTNTNINVSGSVVASGTVTANQGTGFGSIATHIKSGSVIAVLGGNTSVLANQAGTWVPSAIGYLRRNDTLASVLGADGTYRVMTGDSAGRMITKPFSAEESRVEGYHSVVSTSVTTLVAAAGAGLRNYITDFFIANTGTAATLITFKDGAGSILGYTIAPATGGSNAPGIATPMRTGTNASFDFQATPASSIVYATVKGFKAP